MNIQVMGSGCPTCKKLFEQTKKIVKELKLEADVEYVTDITKIIKMGLMQSPVLVIDGQPTLSGGGQSDDAIKDVLLKKTVKESHSCHGCSCGGKC